MTAGIARWLLDPVLSDEVPFVTFFLAVVFAGWYGGRGPAALAAVLGGIGAWYAFMPPQFSFGIRRSEDAVGLLVYFFVTFAIAALSGAMREAQRRSRAAERSALRQREMMRITLASIGDAVITTDAQGMVTFLNGVAETLCGWTSAEARGQPLERVFTIINESTRAPAENPVTAVLQSGQGVTLANHTVLISKDGTERPVDDSAAPIRDDRGHLVGVVLVFRDVSARRAADAGSRHLAAIVATSDDAIVSKNLDGIITSWNRAAERIFGYTADEMIGESVMRLIPADHADEEPEILRRIRLKERVDHFETIRQRRDGRRIPVSLTISPIVAADGRIIGVSKIARDITQQKQTEEALRDADRRKDEFLALLAHELRNPLASVRNALHLLERTDGEKPATAMMQRQVDQMVRLIDDLLDVNRISRGKMGLRKERIDLTAVVEEALDAVRPLCDRLTHTLSVSLPEQPLYVHGDANRLTQVIGNLLDNACKFTPRGGQITLTVAREGESAVIRIRDNGIGIAIDQLAQVFEMFVQADTSLERAQSGLGLGLTLAKSLVEMHDGTIEGRSDGLGHGSEFVVRLPLLTEPVSRPAARNERAQAEARRILIVDDNRDSADSLALLMELSGHTVRAAYDGLEAVQAASEFRPEVILLDIGLPKLNGYEAAQRIRALPGGAQVLLIALTGWGQDADRRRSEQAGFDVHLVKPLDHAALMQLLAEWTPRAA